MALQNQQNSVGISGNGDQSYAFALPFFASTDIKCFEQLTSTSTPTELTKTADGTAFGSLSAGEFSISFTDKTVGGTVIIKTSNGVALATGQTATIERVVPLTQDFDLKEGAAIDPTALNTALDRVVAQNQQNADSITKAITFPATDSGITYGVTESAASRAGKVLGFDATGSVAPLNVTTLSTGTQTTIAGGNGITNNDGTISVNNDSNHIDFDGSGKLKIATDGVTALELADNAVDTAAIADNSVVTAKLPDSTGTSDGVTLPKLRHIPTDKVLGRVSASDGDVELLDLKDEDDMGSDSDSSLATQQSIKAYVNAQAAKAIPRAIIPDTSGTVTYVATGSTLDGGTASEDAGSGTITKGNQDNASNIQGAISGDYLDYFVKISSNSSAAHITNQTLQIPLSGLSSSVSGVTIQSSKIVGVFVRPSLQVDAHDDTGAIDSDNPQVKIEYYMPRGQTTGAGTLNNTNYRYEAIGWRREVDGAQYSNLNMMTYLPVNAAAGQSSLLFRFNAKNVANAGVLRLGLTIHAVNMVTL